jgi:hypothetical protein
VDEALAVQLSGTTQRPCDIWPFSYYLGAQIVLQSLLYPFQAYLLRLLDFDGYNSFHNEEPATFPNHHWTYFRLQDLDFSSYSTFLNRSKDTRFWERLSPQVRDGLVNIAEGPGSVMEFIDSVGGKLSHEEVNIALCRLVLVISGTEVDRMVSSNAVATKRTDF